MVIVDVIQALNAVKRHTWEHVIQSLLLLLLDDSLKHLQALCWLVWPLLEFLVEHLLILILDQVVVGLVILCDDSQGLWLHGSLEELGEAVVIGLVLLEIYHEIPVDDIQEDLFESIELFDLDEAAPTGEEVVRVEDVWVELLSDECRRQDQSEAYMGISKEFWSWKDSACLIFIKIEQILWKNSRNSMKYSIFSMEISKKTLMDKCCQ